MLFNERLRVLTLHRSTGNTAQIVRVLSNQVESDQRNGLASGCHNRIAFHPRMCGNCVRKRRKFADNIIRDAPDRSDLEIGIADQRFNGGAKRTSGGISGQLNRQYHRYTQCYREHHQRRAQ